MSRVRPDLNYASTTYGPPRGIRRPRRPISPAVRRYLDRKLRRQRDLFNRSNRRQQDLFNRSNRRYIREFQPRNFTDLRHRSAEELRRIAELRRRQQEQIMRSRDSLDAGTVVGGKIPRLQKAIIPGTPEYEAQQQRIANMPQELKDLQASIQQKQLNFQHQRMQDPEFIAFRNRQQEFIKRQMSNPEYQELQRAAMMAQRQGIPFVPTDAQKMIQQNMRTEQDLFQRQMQQDPYFARMQAEDEAFRKANQQENEIFTTRMQEYMQPQITSEPDLPPKRIGKSGGSAWQEWKKRQEAKRLLDEVRKQGWHDGMGDPPSTSEQKQKILQWNRTDSNPDQEQLKRMQDAILREQRGRTGGGQQAERNPHIQPDFYNSPEYDSWTKGSQIGTMDMYYSPYFGQQGSGSIGRALDRAYQTWANRTGNEAVKGPPRTVRIPDKNVPTPAPALPMPPPTTVSPPKRRTGPPRTKVVRPPQRPPRKTHGDPRIPRRPAPTGGRKLPAGWRIDPKTGKPTGGHRRPPRRDPRPKLTDGSTYANPYDPRKGDNYNMIAQMPATPGPSAPVQTRPAKQMDIPTNKVLARLPSDFEPLPTVESQMKDLLGPKASNALAKNQVIYGKSDPQNEPAWAKAAREKAKNMQFTRGRIGFS